MYEPCSHAHHDQQYFCFSSQVLGLKGGDELSNFWNALHRSDWWSLSFDISFLRIYMLYIYDRKKDHLIKHTRTEYVAIKEPKVYTPQARSNKH